MKILGLLQLSKNPDPRFLHVLFIKTHSYAQQSSVLLAEWEKLMDFNQIFHSLQCIPNSDKIIYFVILCIQRAIANSDKLRQFCLGYNICNVICLEKKQRYIFENLCKHKMGFDRNCKNENGTSSARIKKRRPLFSRKHPPKMVD